MNLVYQFTAFLSISLMAIVAAVFVVGVSLLGKAIKRSSQEKTRIEEKNKEDIQGQIIMLQESLSGCTDKEKATKFEKEIRDLKTKLDKHDKQIKKIEKGPNFLTVKGGVLHPCFFLFLSLVLSVIASGLSNRFDIYINFWTSTFPVLIWFGGIFSIYWAIRIIVNSLRIIQDVALASDEAVLRDNVEALTEALQMHDESKKPVLDLVVEKPKRPIRVYTGSQFDIQFYMNIKRGDLAQNIDVYFFAAPDTLTFPDMHTYYQEEPSGLAGFLSTVIKIDNMKKGMLSHSYAIHLKAPQKGGKYKLAYKINAHGYDSGHKEIEIKVIKKRKKKH